MVQHTERIAEILAAIRKGNDVRSRQVEADVGMAAQLLTCHVQRRFGRVDAVQQANARSDACRPSPGATTKVEPLGVGGQFVERQYPEITVEQLAIFLADQGRLVIGGPFLAKSLHCRTVDIVRNAVGAMAQPIPFPWSMLPIANLIRLTPATDSPYAKGGAKRRSWVASNRVEDERRNAQVLYIT